MSFLREENTKSKEKVSSSIYTTEIFDRAQVKLVWEMKRSSANVIYTTQLKIYSAQLFWPRKFSWRHAQFKVKMADEDLMISQSSKLNYRHQNWQQFAGKTRLP